jgi:hypothetical protein
MVETWATIIVLMLIMSGAAILGFTAMNRFFGDWQTRSVQSAPRSGDNNSIRQSPSPSAKPTNLPSPQ